MKLAKSMAGVLVIYAALLCSESCAVAADLEHGQQIYDECKGCHALRENGIGPRHCWVVGRAAAKVPDYNYSQAMKNSHLVWDAKTLDEFLNAPLAFLPDTNMGYAGLYDPKEREDVIAYLTKLTNDPELCDGVDKLH